MTVQILLIGICLGLLLSAVISKITEIVRKDEKEKATSKEEALKSIVSQCVETKISQLYTHQKEMWDIHLERILRLERPDLKMQPLKKL